MRPVHEVVHQAALRLIAIAENPQRESRLLLAHALASSYEEIYFAQSRLLTADEEAAFNALLQRRLDHEPLSKIRGCREFWGLPFRVTKDTLDPRPDSETLVEAVLAACPDKTQPWRILDLGTGTGCLLLSLLHEYPQAWGVGVDRSEAASAIAQQNAQCLNLANRCAFLAGHWGEALQGPFDIIISNPPYIGRHEPLSPAVTHYDPPMALFAGEDGLSCYRELATQLPKLATSATKIFLEMGDGQAQAIKALFAFAHPLCTALDLSGKERCFGFHLPDGDAKKL